MRDARALRRPWTVAFLYSGDFRRGAITGAEIAECAFLKALIEARPFGALHVFSRLDAAQEEAFRDHLAAGGRADVRFHAVRRLPEVLRASPPDLALCPYTFHHQLDPLRRERAFPIAGFVHSVSDLEAKSGIARNLRMPLGVLDRALCPSRAVERAVQAIAEDTGEAARGAPRTRIVPLGVEAGLFAPPDPVARERARASLALAPDEVAFLYAGRLSPWSKMDLLPLLGGFADAVGRSAARLRLVIAGQQQAGGYTDALQERAAQLGIGERVTMLEGIARAELPRVFAAADVFVSPSDNRQETFGLTLLEAMATRLPVIAADWNGYREVLDGAGVLLPSVTVPSDPGRVGALLYSGVLPVAAHLSQTTAISVPHLAGAILALAGDAGLRRRLGAVGRERYLDRYTWERVLARMLPILDAQVELARALRGPPAGPAGAELAMNFDRCFAHYPSHRWTDETVLTTRPARDEAHFRLLESLARVADLDWERCLALDDAVRSAGGRRPAASVVGVGGRADDDRRCLAFLVKHAAIGIDWDALPVNDRPPSRPAAAAERADGHAGAARSRSAEMADEPACP